MLLRTFYFPFLLGFSLIEIVYLGVVAMQEFQIHEVGPSPFIKGFTLFDAKLSSGITLRFARGGRGPALLMVHGHPHNHVIWRKVAPNLAKDHTVILPDMRGYGDSSKPASDAEHRPYSKREMAKDLVGLMTGLGFNEFHYAGHDRGARVGHRLALDYQDLVKSAVFLDIAPTAVMYERTNMEFAQKYFWWFFLTQPEPLPEKMILSDPEFFLKRHIGGQLKTPGATEPEVMAEYLRCYKNPEEIHAICEDYRAAQTIDLVDDAQDREKRIVCPLLLLWGAKGTVGKLYDVVETWSDRALKPEGEALPCGHSVEEEVPEIFLEKYRAFLSRIS